MSRERIIRLVLRSYPPAVRASSGDEMLATSLDAGGRSNPAFARELVDLVRFGLAARASSTAQLGARRLIADGLCYGGIIVIAELLCVRVGDSITLHLGGAVRVCEMVVLAAALVLALIGYDRIAAICTLSYFAVFVAERPALAATWKALLPDLIALVVCFTPMLVTPRRGKRDIRRVAWLVVIAALAAAFYTPNGGFAVLFLLPVAVVVPFALVLLPTDPRFAIACSLAAAFVGIVGLAESLQNGQPQVALPLTVLVLTATPLVLGIAAARTRSLRQRDPA